LIISSGFLLFGISSSAVSCSSSLFATFIISSITAGSSSKVLFNSSIGLPGSFKLALQAKTSYPISLYPIL